MQTPDNAVLQKICDQPATISPLKAGAIEPVFLLFS